MENQKNLITAEGKEKLQKELRVLIDVERTKNLKALQEAREQGDLSENADYDAAKNRQAEIESRIKEIQSILDHAEIIKEGKDDRRVKVGCTVTYTDLDSKSKNKIEIVGEVEADAINNKISNLSPLAKAILGKTVGAVAEIHGIEQPYKIKINEIEAK